MDWCYLSNLYIDNDSRKSNISYNIIKSIHCIYIASQVYHVTRNETRHKEQHSTVYNLSEMRLCKTTGMVVPMLTTTDVMVFD